MIKNKQLANYLSKNTEASPLVVFRIFFGLLLFIGLIRFWSNGWIEDLYIKPNFFFSYYGFEFVKPLGTYTYILFFICGIASLMVMLGYKYRLSTIILFVSFTYIELMDKTYYLNHYYFVSLICFLLIFIPSNSYFSIDAYLNPKIKKEFIPKYCIDAIKLMLCIVYFYAGIAKLNSDWMLSASPLNIWLPVKNDLVLIGDLMSKKWFHYLMSWSGAFYDLLIPFLLLKRSTRAIAFFLVVVFHLFTSFLFPIGMFPYIMIVSTLIFFSSTFHNKIINFFAKYLRIDELITEISTSKYKLVDNHSRVYVFIVFFSFQLIFPFRYLFYPGELFWTEQGYRFSWRVMLIEKAGFTEFKVVDKKTGKKIHIDNRLYLTTTQEKQMSFQPDFILQYAHYLGDLYKEKGMQQPQVFADSYVTLNGRLSKRFIKEDTDLYLQKDNFFKHKDWIIPFSSNKKIKGF